MLNEQLFHHSGLNLNFATGPRNGPAFVFFHGVTRRWQSFVPLIPALSTRWHIHALDHRGHGQSSRAKFGYLVRDYVRDALPSFGVGSRMMLSPMRDDLCVAQLITMSSRTRAGNSLATISLHAAEHQAAERARPRVSPNAAATAAAMTRSARRRILRPPQRVAAQ